MKKVLLTALLAAGITAAAACSKDATAVLPTDISGTYSLNNISGFTLPVPLSTTDSTSVFIEAGTLVLQSTGTFSLTETDHVVTQSQDSTSIQTSVGTYTFSGGNINLHYPDRNVDVKGTYATNTVTLGSSNIKFVYRKQ